MLLFVKLMTSFELRSRRWKYSTFSINLSASVSLYTLALCKMSDNTMTTTRYSFPGPCQSDCMEEICRGSYEECATTRDS